MKLGRREAVARSKGAVEVNCRRSLAAERGAVTATFDCINCGAPGDLRSSVCYGNVLDAFVEDVQIDRVVLAGLKHRQYAEDLSRILQAQADLVRVGDRAALRPGAAEAEKNAQCGGCTLRPGVVFGDLSEKVRAAPTRAAEEIEGIMNRLQAAAVPRHHTRCKGCVDETREAGRHLHESAVETRARVNAAAYNLVEGPA